jgi:hypothetical protein
MRDLNENFEMDRKKLVYQDERKEINGPDGHFVVLKVRIFFYIESSCRGMFEPSARSRKTPHRQKPFWASNWILKFMTIETRLTVLQA